MIINKKKSGIMYSKPKDNKEMRRVYKEEQILGYPIVENYKFLGITIAPNFDLSPHFETLKKKIKYITYKALTLPRKVITPFHASVLWTLLVRSNAFYGFLIMDHLNARKADKLKWIMIYRKSLKSFLKLDNTSNQTLDRITCADELLEEAKYRSDLANFKWKEYKNDLVNK